MAYFIRKCINSYLGVGSKFRANGLMRKECSMICTDCNLRVNKWLGYKWDYNQTNYLFFRANFGDFAMLKPALLEDDTSAAFSCGCKGYCVMNGEPVPNGYNWKCTGCEI